MTINEDNFTELPKAYKVFDRAERVINQAGYGPIEEVMAFIEDEYKAPVLADAIIRLEDMYSEEVLKFHASPDRTVEGDSENGHLAERLQIVKKLEEVVNFTIENRGLIDDGISASWSRVVPGIKSATLDPVEEVGAAALEAECKVFSLLTVPQENEKNEIKSLENDLYTNRHNIRGAEGKINAAVCARLSTKALGLMRKYQPSRRPAASSTMPRDAHPALPG